MNLRSFFQRQPSVSKESPIWQQYLRFFEEKPAKKTPFRDLRFVVLDTETSGLDYKKDKLLSVAALSVSNFQIDLQQRFEAFFYRPDYAPDESVKVHGILGSRLKMGQQEKTVLLDLLAFLKNSIIVGHHIGFDVAILNHALQRHFGIQLRNSTLDTGWLAKRIENPTLRGFNPSPLDQLCAEYRIPLGERHTAAGDAYITSLLFLKLLGRLGQRGVKLRKDLL
ncbi:MAG: 3'-5' exonuclease [Bacteroidota bacterium]